MNKLSIATIIAAATLTTPAFADEAATARWTGLYASFNYGQYVTEDGFSGASYGASIGWNVAVGQSGLIAGIDLKTGQYDSYGFSYTESYASLLLGKAFSEEIFAYGFVGYGDDDGEAVQLYGIGMDYALTDRISVGGQVVRSSTIVDGYNWTSTLAQVKYAF